jgi:hypothetical protein
VNDMTPQELADSIKLIRNRHNDGRTIDPLDAIQAINQLVELVAEMQAYIATVGHHTGCDFMRGFPRMECSCEFAGLFAKADALLSGLKEEV